MRKVLLALALVSLAAAPSFAAQCTQSSTLACPSQGVAGAIISSDCAAMDGSGYDLWKFEGTAGQTITIDLSSTAFDTLLALIDPNGKPVALSDDRTDGTTDSRITYTLETSGTWTISAHTLAAGGAGDYFLSLTCPGASTGPRRRAATKQ